MEVLQAVYLEGVVGEHLEQLMGVVGEALRANHVPKQSEQPGQQMTVEVLAGLEEEVLIVKVPAGEEVPGWRELLVEVAGHRTVFLMQAEVEVFLALEVEEVREEEANLEQLRTLWKKVLKQVLGEAFSGQPPKG
jgi:hypothetical protein